MIQENKSSYLSWRFEWCKEIERENWVDKSNQKQNKFNQTLWKIEEENDKTLKEWE